MKENVTESWLSKHISQKHSFYSHIQHMIFLKTNKYKAGLKTVTMPKSIIKDYKTKALTTPVTALNKRHNNFSTPTLQC